jgi:hypothetical protein
MATGQALLKMTIYKPKPGNVDAMRRAILRAVDETVDVIQSDFKDVTGTWKHETYPQRENAHIVGDDAVGGVSSDDLPLFLLDEGTPVRHAVLSRDWRSKTTVRTIKSGHGAGRVLYINKNVRLPGVEAREFSDVIAEHVEPILHAKVDAAVRANS